MGFVKKQEGK